MTFSRDPRLPTSDEIREWARTPEDEDLQAELDWMQDWDICLPFGHIRALLDAAVDPRSSRVEDCLAIASSTIRGYEGFHATELRSLLELYAGSAHVRVQRWAVEELGRFDERAASEQQSAAVLLGEIDASMNRWLPAMAEGSDEQFYLGCLCRLRKKVLNVLPTTPEVKAQFAALIDAAEQTENANAREWASTTRKLIRG